VPVVVDGHDRKKVATSEGRPMPFLIGSWTPDQERRILATLDPVGALAQPDPEKLAELLGLVNPTSDEVKRVTDDLYEHVRMIQVLEIERGRPKVAPGALKRVLPLDFIYSLGGDSTCCMAIRAGFLYGIQSGRNVKVCPYCGKMKGHDVEFIDNEFKNYDHTVHLDVVAQYAPKYATVRDMMTRAQCEEAGIEYCDPEAILVWAEQVARFARHTIVIPKHPDYLEMIPDKYVIGYSIPSQYAGSPFPIEVLRGRKIHLLGGSWEKQLACIESLQDDIVSLDNNHINLMARYGQFVAPDGTTIALDDLVVERLNNPKYASIGLSFAFVSAKVKEMAALGLSIGVIGRASFDIMGQDVEGEELDRVDYGRYDEEE